MRERSVVVYTVAMAASGAGLTAILGSGTSDTVLTNELHQIGHRLPQPVAIVDDGSRCRRTDALPRLDQAVPGLVEAAAARWKHDRLPVLRVTVSEPSAPKP